MNHFENIIKIGVVTAVLFVPLFIISPFLDHQFKRLEDDLNENKSRLQIIAQVLTHLVILVILSYSIFRLFEHFLERYMKIQNNEYIREGYRMVGAVVFVGLQKNLMEKLNYITSTHRSRTQ